MHITIRHIIKIIKSSKLCKASTRAQGRDRSLPASRDIDRFELLTKIGDGAFSDVYKARDKETQRLVAIKVAYKMSGRCKVNRHVLKEAQLMRHLHHPNLVHLLFFTQTNDATYLVMDLCQGGELYDLIVQWTFFNEDLARHIITQVAHGVQYLHEQCGIVHRDIKPENILIQPSPGRPIDTVKLADFGLSKVIHGSERLDPCGTLSYTAPEIVTEQRYSASVDMWALGCVLYTMLCGYPPFHGDGMVRRVVKGQYCFASPWWDPISDAAKDLIRHLLTVDPHQRYTIRQLLTHPWTTP